MYAYTSNNPVMRVDPSGYAWYNPFSWSSETWMKVGSGAMVVAGVTLMATGVGGLLGGALLAAGVGSYVGGISNEANGGSFFAGWAAGGIAGFSSGVGIGLGAIFYQAATTATVGALSYGITGLATSFAFAGGGSFGATLLQQKLDGNPLDYKQAGINGLMAGMLSMVATPYATAANYLSNNVSRVLGTSFAVSIEGIYDVASFGINKAISWAEQQTIPMPVPYIPVPYLGGY
jgi:hypothetical protein